MVTDEDTQPTVLGIDPSAPGYATHLPFYLILRQCGLAWRTFLMSLHGFGDSVIVPHLSANFVAEVHAGAIEIEVVPIHIGTTSFTLRCTMLQEEHAVEIGLDVITYRDHAYRMPLAQSRRLHARRGQLVPPTVVVIQPKVALQGVGSHDIVVPCGKAKHDATRGISSPCHGLELDGDVDIRVRR